MTFPLKKKEEKGNKNREKNNLVDGEKERKRNTKKKNYCIFDVFHCGILSAF